jgi:hypothetical protein
VRLDLARRFSVGSDVLWDASFAIFASSASRARTAGPEDETEVVIVEGPERSASGLSCPI